MYFPATKGTIAIAVAVMIGIVCIVSAKASMPVMTSVAEVGGEPITAREFNRLLEYKRASVIDYFRRKYGAENSKDFWQTSYNGEVPADLARQWALQEAIRTKIILQLAKSRGIVQETSYDALLAEMDRENQRRKAAVQAGQPVYGPVQFDERVFLEFFMSRLLIHLKEKLSEAELTVTDEQLLQHYETIKDTLFKVEDNVQFYKISVSYLEGGHRMDSDKKLKAKEMMDIVKQRLEEGIKARDAVKQLLDANDTLEIQITEEQFNSDTARNYYKSLPELYEALTDPSETDQGSPVIDDQASGQYVLASIIGREPNGYRSFEEQKGNVHKHYVDSLFNTYVNKLIEEAEVKIMD